MARGVGVEVGNLHVRVAVVDTTPKRVRLVAFHEQLIPTDDSRTPAERQAEALKTAVAAARARGRVAASLDSGDAVLREVSLPFKADDQIRKTYRFELESLIHNYAIEDLVCDYFKVSETDKSATVLAAAVPRKVVEARLAVLQKAGVDPAALDLDVTALFNACARIGAIDTDEPFLIVHGTSRFTKIILVENRRPRSIRTIRFSFPAAGAKAAGADLAAPAGAAPEPDEALPLIVLPDGDEAPFEDLDVGQRATLIGILAKEISRFLLANAAAASPTHILLAGEYEIEEAAHMLENGTRLPVRPLGILGRIDHSLPEGSREAAALRSPVVVGLALKACDEDVLGLDFRRQEFAYGRKYETLKTTGLVTLQLALVLLAAVALHFYFVAQDRQAAHAEMLRLHAGIFEDATGRNPGDPEQAFEDLVAYERELQSRLGGGDHPIERSALDLANQFWRALAKLQEEYTPARLEDKELYVLIETMHAFQITQPGNESVTLEVGGVIQSVAYADALRRKLKETEPFNDRAWEIDIPQYAPTPDGRQRFTVKITKARRRP